MNYERIAKRYAHALFAISNRDKRAAETESDLKILCDIIDSEKSFKEFIFNPTIACEFKLNIIHLAFDKKISSLVIELMRVLLEKHREYALEQIQKEFVKLRRKEEKVIYIEVTAAYSLTESEKVEIINKIEFNAGKKIEALFKIDPKLIAGMKIEAYNNVFDGSVQNGLRRLRETMLYDVLKQTTI